MNVNNRRLLFIAYYFPPLGGIASMRSANNVKYLSQMGFDVQVLTVNTRFIRHPKDKALLNDIPKSVKVFRSFCPDAGWLFKLLWGLKLGSVVKFLQQRVLIPDAEVLWRPFAKRKLNYILKNVITFDAAVISSGPPSSLSLGLYLKSRYKIPFICDFRDEWTNNPERINVNFPAATQARELVMESRILSAAAGVAYLTDIMKDNFIGHYHFLANKPSAIIPNGFDEDDFAGLQASNHRDAFHLVYCGSFYDRRQPDPLWKAIVGLFDGGQLQPDKIVVDIIGRNTPAFVLGKYANDERIKRIVKFHGFMSHSASLLEMMKADSLLLYIPSGKNAESVLTGKIFDYIRSGKPVLAVVPPTGLAASIVREARTGYIADYSDIPGIASRLMELYRLWKNRALNQTQPDWDYINSFSRRELANRLAGLINEALAGRDGKVNNITSTGSGS
jgi:glycosyltransferase involved in cell wall biosynthesis